MVSLVAGDIHDQIYDMIYSFFYHQEYLDTNVQLLDHPTLVPLKCIHMHVCIYDVFVYAYIQTLL